MKENSEVKKVILQKFFEANELIPKIEKPDLPIDETIGVSGWYDFENSLWKKGEEIRQQILLDKSLRSDDEIQNKILSIAIDKRAKRGRQSFVLLLGYKVNQHMGKEILSQIDDQSVTGQIIISLYKMGARNFKKEVEPYTKSKQTWIRNYANKYIESAKY